MRSFLELCHAADSVLSSTENRIQVKFALDEAAAVKRSSHPLFLSSYIAGESTTLHFQKKSTVDMRMPWAVGMSVLELSKLEMQRMFYEEIRPRYPQSATVLMTDTDSWILLVREKDSEAFVKNVAHLMDFSSYPPGHHLHSNSRKHQLGFLKNETGSREISEFVGVRSKTYALRMDDGEGGVEEAKRAKGIKRSFQKRICFDDYLRCLQETHAQRVTQMTLLSKNHTISMVETNKIAFTSFDVSTAQSIVETSY